MTTTEIKPSFMSSPKSSSLELILGSQSPRRREILSYFSLPFHAASPQFDEESVEFHGDPVAYVRALCAGKGQSLCQAYPDAAILTADTVVFREGKIYNKPSSPEEAEVMLGELVNRWHTVYTGLALRTQKESWFEVESTRVLFNKWTPEQIRWYVKQLAPLDKAGAYAIQGAGGLIVKRIEGCYYNVMGLPIGALAALLTHLNIHLWEHLRESPTPPSRPLSGFPGLDSK